MITGFINKIYDNNKIKFIIFSNYPEWFFNNKKIYRIFSLSKANDKIFHKSIIKLLNYLEGTNILNFASKKYDENDLVFLSKFKKNTHIIEAHSQHFNFRISNKNFNNQIFFSSKEIELYEKKLNLPKKFSLIHSEGKMTYAAVKSWDHENMQKIVDYFNNINWVQIGLSNEVRLKNVDDKFNLSLRELAFVIYKCEFIVCLEGLYNHIASCFFKKTFLILSGQIPFACVKYKNVIPVTNLDNINCYPCYKLMKCNLTRRICMEDLSPHMVINAINRNYLWK